MTKVQVGDFECPICNKIGLAELDVKSGVYVCLMCNSEIKFGAEEKNE